MKTLIFTFWLYMALCHAPSIEAKPIHNETNRVSLCRQEVLENSKFENDSNAALRGITMVTVVIAPTPPDTNLNVKTIKMAVEQKCRKEGLIVTDGRDWKKTSVLSINLHDLEGRKNVDKVCILTVEMAMEAIRVNNMVSRILAPLYRSERTIGIGNRSAAPEQIQASALYCVDKVINEWKRNNGKIPASQIQF